MNIKGKIVTLRALEIEDLPLLTKWSNSPEIWYNLGGWHFPYSSLSTEEYIKNINNIKGIAGCTLLGDGSISLIIDPAGLSSRIN